MADLKDFPPLLHDARLTDCRWDRHLKTLDLGFHCLRRNDDGTPIEDSTVDLKLGGVEQIVAHYSPASVTVRLSEFESPSRTTLADLEEWPHGAVEAQLSISSPQAEFDEATACVRESLAGDPRGRPATRRCGSTSRSSRTTTDPKARSWGCPATATRWSCSPTVSRSKLKCGSGSSRRGGLAEPLGGEGPGNRRPRTGG